MKKIMQNAVRMKECSIACKRISSVHQLDKNFEKFLLLAQSAFDGIANLFASFLTSY
jgi:hypothetical protein